MNLPPGLSYRPRQERLIAKDEPAVIQIETGTRYPGNADYKLNDRVFEEAIAPYLRGDWADLDQRHRLSHSRQVYVAGSPQQSPVVYSGAEHRGNPKLPNITVVPNLFTQESTDTRRLYMVFGCTVGHHHPAAREEYRVQEVYEFQSYGMLALDRERGEIELWIARDGDKVVVPNACHMTLYNLGDEDSPLVTLDFADPDRNASGKNLVREFGPLLLAYYNAFEVVFVLNRLYINSHRHAAGVHLASQPSQEEERQVKIARGSRLDLGRFLHEQLTQNPDVIGQFAKLGLRIKRASPEAVLEPLPPGEGSRLYFSQPLVEATKKGTEVHRYFFPGTEQERPGPPQGRGIAALEADLAQEKERLIELVSLNRLLVVVEGSGDWVERTYRPLFEKKVEEGKVLAVFYADDTRWKSRPKWADPESLHPWETYLDKADPGDLAVYQNLRPDVVFIVTPDFTHSGIARWWLGKTPLVFVEKPFDSQIDNVNDLLRELGRMRGTAILGLDHFQFYALPVHDLKSAVVEHIGGALASAVFYMTEDRPIELGREQSLQYGLMLDMLPHLLGLLTYFASVATIDEIRVVQAGRYRPLIAADRTGAQTKDISSQFHNETYLRLKFTFQDYSGNGHHVPCLAIVGKGFSQEVKYLEITGRSGSSIRIDLRRKPEPNPDPAYPWSSLFFMQQTDLPEGAQIREVSDPYDPSRTLRMLYDPRDPLRFCRPLERARYERLLDDLLNGTRMAVASALLMTEAPEIVEALDRIWWAIQDSRTTWVEYELGKVNPVEPARAFQLSATRDTQPETRS